MGRFGALLRILKPPYDVSHEKLGWHTTNLGVFRELYFETFLRFGFLRFGLSQNSNFRLYRDLTAQSGKPDETPWVISSNSSCYPKHSDRICFCDVTHSDRI